MDLTERVYAHKVMDELLESKVRSDKTQKIKHYANLEIVLN